ncbi:Glycosyltransferase family 92 protein [Caenorhabditis elegans]|uniref:Glycosyltransferase family 92 protein n=1 Tax=Caenorhabditis elegans TaxID=6239 RepID=O61984_CAEEL|nr:Glycosyltransferase family 92 protein [Caenorhabditis elegans]CCD67033.2 Glycosyltransferase family 92 protein [Caenorhabditis elegans]|eukprot:NP_503439.2 Uncharacterized protein CELE_K02H11.4 [Caenorhabditis elegans]
MELKTMKILLLSVTTTIYLTTFFILPSILENGDQYLQQYDSFKQDVARKFFGDPVTNTDAYIVNTYYYPTSKSLGDNALAMVLLMNRSTMRNITKYKMQLVATNSSGSSVTVVPKLLKEAYANCEYSNIVAHVTALPSLKKLEMVSGDSKFDIQLKLARSTAPAPVIICISPQFVAEQWQIFVAHAHISHNFGGHLHLYVTSMLESYFDLVLEYEKLGYVTLDFWMRYNFANSALNSPEPNSNVEWRNQAGAHTDCLLQYKEAAKFITFADLDDVLIPRGYETYFHEFASLFYFHPNIRTFQYPKQEMMFHNKPNISDFHMIEQFSHSWFANTQATGKIVARPSDLNSMWIHRSFNVPDKNFQVVSHNFFIHLQRPVDTDGQDPITYEMRSFSIAKHLKLNASVMQPVQEDFVKVLNSSRYQKITAKLPKNTYYFPILFRCYYEKYYNAQDDTCPNGEDCLIPQRSDLPCIHSDADYKSGPSMTPVTFHYHKNPRWSKNIGCYN